MGGAEMKIKQSLPYRIFSVVNTVVLGILAICCIIPFIHILAVSFSDMKSTTAGIVGLWPIGFNFESYTKALGDPAIWKAMGVNLGRMVLGTVYSMVLTISGWKMTGKLAGLGLMLVGIVFLLTALFVYNAAYKN